MCWSAFTTKLSAVTYYSHHIHCWKPRKTGTVHGTQWVIKKKKKKALKLLNRTGQKSSFTAYPYPFILSKAASMENCCSETIHPFLKNKCNMYKHELRSMPVDHFRLKWSFQGTSASREKTKLYTYPLSPLTPTHQYPSILPLKHTTSLYSPSQVWLPQATPSPCHIALQELPLTPVFCNLPIHFPDRRSCYFFTTLDHVDLLLTIFNESACL